MRVHVFIIFFVFCLPHFVSGQDTLTARVEKGYLFSLYDRNDKLEAVVFVPTRKIAKEVDFKKLQEGTGLSIKGYMPKTEERLRKKGKSYSILIPLASETKEMTNTPFVLRIMPVKLTYKIDTGGSVDKSGVPFTLNNKKYIIHYNFYYNFDVIEAKEL